MASPTMSPSPPRTTPPGKPYTSWAKIEVQSPPAVVELARPSSLYITDEVDTLPLTWSLANFNGDGKEFRLVITNNTTCLALPT